MPACWRARAVVSPPMPPPAIRTCNFCIRATPSIRYPGVPGGRRWRRPRQISHLASNHNAGLCLAANEARQVFRRNQVAVLHAAKAAGHGGKLRVRPVNPEALAAQMQNAGVIAPGHFIRLQPVRAGHARICRVPDHLGAVEDHGARPFLRPAWPAPVPRSAGSCPGIGHRRPRCPCRRPH